jgi:hypothetical protein
MTNDGIYEGSNVMSQNILRLGHATRLKLAFFEQVRLDVQHSTA